MNNYIMYKTYIRNFKKAVYACDYKKIQMYKAFLKKKEVFLK